MRSCKMGRRFDRHPNSQMTLLQVLESFAEVVTSPGWRGLEFRSVQDHG